MADTQTAKLGAIKPEVGSSPDSWGGKQNAAFDIFDAAISGTPAIIASAANTDLSATTVPTLEISGSVTILDFGAAVSGMIRRLYFSGAPLLTHDPLKLQLPGNVNLQMAAGDTVEIVRMGTIWRLFSRLPFAVAASPIPIGSLMDYAGTAAPSGWLLCFGQTISRTTYSALFAIVNTTYGVGDGSTTFNLPDLRGRVIAGKDDMGGTSANRLTAVFNGDILGGSGGAETIILTTANLAAHTHTGPSHTHTFTDTATTSSAGNHTHEYDQETGFSSATTGVVSAVRIGTKVGITSSDGAHTHSVTVSGTTGAGGTGATGSAGSGTAHFNVQPTFILNKMIYAGV